MRKTKYFEAYLDDMQSVVIYMSLQSYEGNSNFFYVEDEDHNQIPLIIEDDIIIDGYHTYECRFEGDIFFGKQYHVFHEFARATPLIFSNIVKSVPFDRMFFYDGNDLGSVYTKESTTFKLWAPTAYRVQVDIQQGEQQQTLMMKRSDKGVYELVVEQDLYNASYVYYVEVNGTVNKSIDPYGKACTINSKRSVVADFSHVHLQDYPLPPMDSYCDGVVYELSARDYTDRGSIDAFIKEGPQSVLAYCKSLGVTHLQFLPLMDCGSIDDADVGRFYNWGYDALQWMCFEKSYSSDVSNPQQSLYDMANLVNACHKEGFRINLDVVFNHVYEVSDSALHKCVPYYYFQYNPKDEFSNATMCGNDIDSTRKMCRKMIVDSTRYLSEVFHIDGLRFDLMGILDIDTINEVVATCTQINPDFMVYGEGWNMPSYLEESKRACQTNSAQMPQVAHFSDRFRDVIKGSTSIDKISDLGYLLSDTSKIYSCMNVLGASTQNIGDNQLYVNASNCVNYVECHDNMTSWDKISAALHVDATQKKAYHQLLMAGVLLAQGIPFLHGGQEFGRTKQGQPNTYNAPDSINKIDWRLVNKNQTMIQFVRELIALRKEYPLFRMHAGIDVQSKVCYEALQERVLAYYLEDETMALAVYFNPESTPYSVVCKEGHDIIFTSERVHIPYSYEYEMPPQSILVTCLKKQS